jgi:hypothetical protein
MPLKEIDWQTKIIESAKLVGGYGKKWASPFNKGVPDLIIGLPKLGGWLFEVKVVDAKEWVVEKKTPVRMKQLYELRMFAKAGMQAGIMIVVRMPNDINYLAVMPPDHDEFTVELDMMILHKRAVRWLPRSKFALIPLVTGLRNYLRRDLRDITT